MIKCFFFK